MRNPAGGVTSVSSSRAVLLLDSSLGETECGWRGLEKQGVTGDARVLETADMLGGEYRGSKDSCAGDELPSCEPSGPRLVDWIVILGMLPSEAASGEASVSGPEVEVRPGRKTGEELRPYWSDPVFGDAPCAEVVSEPVAGELASLGFIPAGGVLVDKRFGPKRLSKSVGAPACEDTTSDVSLPSQFWRLSTATSVSMVRVPSNGGYVPGSWVSGPVVIAGGRCAFVLAFYRIDLELYRNLKRRLTSFGFQLRKLWAASGSQILTVVGLVGGLFTQLRVGNNKNYARS